MTQEQKRLEESPTIWQKWGPYVAERAWGTVREDYSWNGDAWQYFPHDQAASKAYRWGEDGIAGWCDRYQVLTCAPAFWNTRDPILKERLFGLSSVEGNHGEDVKEYYFHLDGTPTHSYMKYLYKYPQEEYPYLKLKESNQHRGTHEPEFELIDTGVFAQNRYFDIFIEYAKASPEDTCIKIEVFNRGDQEAPLHIIPQLWFRNQWRWEMKQQSEPKITKGEGMGQALCLIADDTEMRSPANLMFDYHVGKRYFYGPKEGSVYFTNNESHLPGQLFFKDGFHRFIIHKEATINPEGKGTKACFHYVFPKIEAQGSIVLYLRLSDQPLKDPLRDVETIIAERKKEADLFYATIHPKAATEEEKRIQRQAIAGLLWNKQIYLCDINQWLEGDNVEIPPPQTRLRLRNHHWRHLNSMRIFMMPDKWEYPWFAAWDLAFHCLTISLVDIRFAKEQLWLLLFDQFQHPNGQIPAYEWEFSDLNPPVQAWSAWKIYMREKERLGKGDIAFLKKCHSKLLVNFVWWINRVDSSGNNVFEGGFLGLDNISLLDRSEKFSEGVKLQQSDGTGWMAMFCLNMLQISLELAKEDSSYEAIATKFFQHFVYIAHAMKKRGNIHYELWSEKDGFFYDVLTFPDGSFAKFRVRSLVGLIPLYAVEILEEENLRAFPEFKESFDWFLQNRPQLVNDCVVISQKEKGKQYLLTLLTPDHLSRVLYYVWNPEEFRSEYGLRSLSKYHEQHPFYFKDRQVGYEPGESFHKIKGGNSNWRGPIWMPTSYLLVDALKRFSLAFPESFPIYTYVEDQKKEMKVDLKTMAKYFADRSISLFDNGKEAKRPFWGNEFAFAQDPHWKDHLLFHEFFHGDNGRGLGASHQTGWTALVANFIDEFRS